MRRLGRSALLISAAMLAFGPSATRSDDAPKVDPKQAEAVDRVLAEWHRHASKITSLEVKFRRTDHSKFLGDKHYEGRAVLASPNLALIESTSLDDKRNDPVAKEKLVFNGRDTFLFNYDRHMVNKFNHSEDWSSPPVSLSLPFFFAMSVNRAKELYHWKVVKEDNQFVFLKATLRGKQSIDSPQSPFIIELDKKTYLPRTIYLMQDFFRGDYNVYYQLEIKIDSVKNLDEMRNPSLDSWKVEEVSMDSLKRMFGWIRWAD
jgi:outer membrane lipoprotein-sorting protein